MMLALFCVTAFAAVDVQSSDASVKVTKNADETQFTVTKESGATAGQLYLVMIQKGAATDLPTADNLYYVDVDKAEDAKFTKVAYPKNLDAGTYTVFLSDYGSANGGRKAVATLNVGTTPVNDDDKKDDPKPGEYQCGDVDHSGGNPDNSDLLILARYVGEWPAYMKEGALDLALGDVDASGGNPDNSDLLILARYVGEWPGYTSLPRK